MIYHVRGLHMNLGGILTGPDGVDVASQYKEFRGGKDTTHDPGAFVEWH